MIYLQGRSYQIRCPPLRASFKSNCSRAISAEFLFPGFGDRSFGYPRQNTSAGRSLSDKGFQSHRAECQIKRCLRGPATSPCPAKAVKVYETANNWRPRHVMEILPNK